MSVFIRFRRLLEQLNLTCIHSFEYTTTDLDKKIVVDEVLIIHLSLIFENLARLVNNWSSNRALRATLTLSKMGMDWLSFRNL